MRSHTGGECQFGASLVITGSLTDFELGYLRIQNNFADAEIGDQIDESDAAIVAASKDTSVAGASVDALGMSAREIQQCLADRYLGICNTTSCPYFNVVSRAIMECVNAQATAVSGA